MISRRDIVKLSAAGLIAPAFSSAVVSCLSAEQHSSGDYPMVFGNAARTGEMPGPLPTFDEPIIVRWVFAPEGKNFESPPAVVDGTLYAGADSDEPGGYVYAINSMTGEERWHLRTAEAYAIHTPTVSDGIVYVNTRADSYVSATSITGESSAPGAIVYAIDANSGEERWRFQAGDIYNFGTVVVGGTAFFSDDEHYLHAVDANSGDERWRFTVSDALNAPTLAEGMVLIGDTSNYLYAVDSGTGEERWRFEVSPGDFPPIVIDDVVFAGGEKGRVHAIDIPSGQERWRFDSDSPYPYSLDVLAAIDGTVFASDVGRLYALDDDTGEERWRISGNDQSETTRAIVVDGMVLIAEEQGLYMVDATSGEEQWRYNSNSGLGGFDGSFQPFSWDFVVADSMAFFSNGELYALGNLPRTVLATDAQVRGAPSDSGVERGTAKAGDTVTNVGAREERNGQMWVEVTIGDVTGWIPLDAIDPTTLPPEGEIEYVYVP